jgi:adenylate cyclase class IV
LGSHDRNGTQNDQGMQEIELKVDDFDRTVDFLKAIGFIIKYAAEKKRTK